MDAGTIEAFYNVQGIDYDLTIKTQLTSISIIILLIFIIPNITWGGYVFYKEALFSIKKVKDYSKRYIKWYLELLKKINDFGWYLLFKILYLIVKFKLSINVWNFWIE